MLFQLLVPTVLIPLLALGVAGAGTVLYLRAHATCTIGIRGQSVTLTVEGNGADDFCSNPDFGQGTAYYRYEGTPTGAELCAGDYRRDDGSTLHYIVRDSGTFTILGTALCKRLQQ
jgi:hypothetical protein